MKKRLIIFFAFLTTILSINLYTVSANNYIAKESTIVMEVSTGRVLSSVNQDNKMYMASTTKILTAICVIENCNLDSSVTIKKEWCGIEGSSIYLKENEKLKVIDLLYGLMLRSGNDTAVSLACYCKGNINNFALLMNETAKKIGATNSNFVNPHGLHDDNHYTTAYDLAKITCYALKNDTFRKIVSTKNITIENSDGYRRVLINKNKMLSNYPDCIGVKTGYTKKAGRCLVSASNRNGMEVVCVVLNCPNMYEESCRLLDYANNNYQMKTLVSKSEVLDFVPVKNRKNNFNTSGFIECAVSVLEDIILPLKRDEVVNICYNIKKSLLAPIKSIEEVGEINIYSGNNLIFSQKVYTINNID